MACSYKDFKELDLNRDEVERLTEALKDKNFRNLLTDYVDEVRDPENQKLYQKEITELEKERGIDVTFINPIAGYVIKTSVNGDQKAFINICANENVSKPTSSVAIQDGTQGRHWTVPHTLAPPRDDYDKKMVRCQVYDVVFHPETLQLAHKFKAFREMVNKTACDAIESNFDVVLDRKNLKFPKIQFKGMTHATVVRKPSKEPPPELSPEEKVVMDEFYAKAEYSKPQNRIPRSPRKAKLQESNSEYTTPKYIIKHCRHIEMDEFTEHKAAKINTATPKELVVEIDLPLLRSSADIVLDVTERSLQLTSEKPAKYNLFITLPYRVNQDCGNARFVKDKKKLVVTLPVVLKGTFDVAKDDSGVESDHSSLISGSPIDEFEVTPSPVVVIDKGNVTPVNATTLDQHVGSECEFLDRNLHYSLPEFVANIYNNNLSFTLNVKNVDSNSIQKLQGASDIHIKFSSVSSGFYTVHYAFYLKFAHREINEVSIETWDNNVIVQINLIHSDKLLRLYFYGVDKSDLIEKYLTEASIISDNSSETVQSSCKEDEPNLELGTDIEADQLLSEIENQQEKHSRAISITSSLSESSGDEVCWSYSPSKGKGILKGFRKTRNFGRSISESGLDEVVWASSIENFNASVDSVIPEEEEISSSFKKTVRFNDVVSRQLFRSNSSILGQRKKKNWRAKAKKRAQERRHSEGEVVGTTHNQKTVNISNKESNNEIFQLEMN